MNKKNKKLRLTLITGLILFITACCVITVLYFTERKRTEITRQEDNFFRLMQEYDILAEIAQTEKEFDELIKKLDLLEKRTTGVETWMSVLKRRRALAVLYPASREEYNNSIRLALEAYPSSQPILAIASAALIKDRGLHPQTEEQLRTRLAGLVDPAFGNLRLALHILLGDFRNPQRAVQISGPLEPSGGFFRDGSGNSEDLFINLAILKILHNNSRGAAADVLTLLNPPFPVSDKTIRFAAEFHFDFGDILRSAELFSLLNDDYALLRQADALYLAGYTDSARYFWALLADNSLPDENTVRSLYNLALTSLTVEEKLSYLEKLAEIRLSSFSGNARQPGLIHYSRLLDHNEAISVLESPGMENSPFLDLELTRRRMSFQEPGRQAAETWLLLDRHYETINGSFRGNKDLYLWAAWKLFTLNDFDETKILINRLQRIDFSEYRVDYYSAMQFMFEGNLDAAANILRSFPAETAPWHVHANLGKIHETNRSHNRALEQYISAAEKVQNPVQASRIQYRIARCHSALGNINEYLRALQNAVDLDSNNLIAQLEIDRI